MRNWCRRRLASSWATPSRTVMSRSLVISSATGWSGFDAKRTSRLVRMPTSVRRAPFGPRSTTGMPEMRCRFISAERVGERLVRVDGDRVHHHARFVLLDEADLLGLRLRLEIAVDDAEAAVLRHGDRHARLRHRVHGRGDDRQVEADRAGQPRRDVDLGRQDLGAPGPQQHVVEGQPLDQLNRRRWPWPTPGWGDGWGPARVEAACPRVGAGP